MMSKEILEALQKGCKELKHLKLTKVRFEDISSVEEIMKILPDAIWSLNMYHCMILIIRLTIMILTILCMSLLSFDEEDLIAFLAYGYAENIKDENRD